jgi:polysaccharide deacetylase family protein (PEP-CTERM system associated)
MSYSFLITIDVEDWFQVENFKSYIPFSSWDSLELRVEKNTHKLLDLFDSIDFKQNPKNTTNTTNPTNSTNSTNQANPTNQYGCNKKVKCTFFILGWIAERLPNLVKEIHQRGHEVASHGYNHELCPKQSEKEFKRDLVTSKKLLEDTIGDQVLGYRAPSFSVNNDIIKLIEDCGYRFDSSYNSFDKHGRYGKLNLNGNGKNGVAYKISNDFFEIPISNLKLKINNSTLPLGGGGYFRLIPSFIFHLGVRSILKTNSAYVFYMHPWEVDPTQPKVNEASSIFKFRHYINLNKTESKLIKLIDQFQSSNFITCSQYLKMLESDH